MNTLEKADIRNIIEMPDLSAQEVCEVIKKELNIEISPTLSKEEMVDEVYNAYQLALQEIENNSNYLLDSSGLWLLSDTVSIINV